MKNKSRKLNASLNNPNSLLGGSRTKVLFTDARLLDTRGEQHTRAATCGGGRVLNKKYKKCALKKKR